MADKLLFILVNSNPKSADSLGTILSQVKVAAAMEFEVDVIFSGLCDILAKKSVAEKLLIEGEPSRTIYDLIKDAYETGVRFKVCPRPFAKWEDDLIPEVDEVVGSAYIISEAMNDETESFTY